MGWFLFNVVAPIFAGFFGVRVVIRGVRHYMDFIPYEWVQFNKPERITYVLASVLYLWVGADMLRKTGGLDTWYIATTSGALIGLYVYWWTDVPDDTDDDDGERAITVGDPFKRR